MSLRAFFHFYFSSVIVKFKISNCSKTPVLCSDILCFLRFYTLFIWFWPKAHKNNVYQILHHFYVFPTKTKNWGFTMLPRMEGISFILLCIHNRTVNWSLGALTLSLLMSYIYIYMEHLFLMFLDHTRRTTVRVVHCCVWSRNIKNRCSIYIYIYVTLVA